MSLGLSHKRALDTEGFGIEQSQLPPFEQGRVDPRAWFEHAGRPFEIEIGTGKGTFLVQQAPLRPQVNYLGIEKTLEFYRCAADRARRRALANVRILWADAGEFLRFWCADGVAAVVHLYFSDPWPKKRHHKRRVVQDRMLVELHRVLQPGGELRLVTDHDELWAWYEDHAGGHEHLFERRPFDRVESAGAGEIVGSNFERKYRTEGRPFHAMTLVTR
ncbi:MAG: tRNA (guanosine(46)-N7)-methyltransferase TrmB [Planctomycetota bacterium]|jgi:tRNA (guanine-N7-)-methyltransferase